ncbi:MAG: exonuclease domain-containing protein [Dermatophilaceae bacterium]
MFLRRATPYTRRDKLLQTVLAGAMRDYLTVALPEPTTDVRDLRLLAVDVETTGMDPRRDELLSVGFVPIDGLAVDLSGARRFVVRSDRAVGQSAAIHGITDDAVASGTPLLHVLTEVLAALRGRVLLAHFTDIEEGFLSVGCRRTFGAPMPCVRIDTLELQRRIIVGHRYGEAPPGTLRLWAARRRYGLPVYKAHQALVDAIACGELFLAQVAEMTTAGPVTLKDLAS